MFAVLSGLPGSIGIPNRSSGWAGFTFFVVKARRFCKPVIAGLYVKRGDETGGTWLILNLMCFCVRFIPVVLSVNFPPACGCPKFRVLERARLTTRPVSG
jgi:hypothetical protein